MRRVLLAALALTMAAQALAAEPTKLRDHNRYKWRDDQGNLHYGDSLPAEAVQNGYEVVNPQGIVVKRVDRAKTAEEKAAAQAEIAKAKQAQEEADLRVRSDQQLLSAYPAEEDLKRAQHQQAEMLDQNLVSARISLQNQEKSLAELLGHAAEFDRNGKPVPETLAKKIADLRSQVEGQRAYIARKETERTDANAKFERDLAHYRELKAKAAERR